MSGKQRLHQCITTNNLLANTTQTLEIINNASVTISGGQIGFLVTKQHAHQQTLEAQFPLKANFSTSASAVSDHANSLTGLSKHAQPAAH